MNSTEWELTLELNEFDEPWMRYAKGFEASKIAISINHPTEEGLVQTVFYDDWRAGKEIQTMTISRRLYQVSPNETKS